MVKTLDFILGVERTHWRLEQVRGMSREECGRDMERCEVWEVTLSSCYQEPRQSALCGSWVRGEGLLGGSFRACGVNSQSILPEAELRTQKAVKVVGTESRSGRIRRPWFSKPACPPANQGENCIGARWWGVASQS